jgi:hypothetical protein
MMNWQPNQDIVLQKLPPGSEYQFLPDLHNYQIVVMSFVFHTSLCCFFPPLFVIDFILIFHEVYQTFSMIKKKNIKWRH